MSDKTKFRTIVAALDAKLLAQVFDTVQNPPEENRYRALKAAIVKNFAESEQIRLQK